MKLIIVVMLFICLFSSLAFAGCFFAKNDSADILDNESKVLFSLSKNVGIKGTSSGESYEFGGKHFSGAKVYYMKDSIHLKHDPDDNLTVKSCVK